MIIATSPAYVDAVRALLPELPEARRARFVDSYELSTYDAGILSDEPATATYFETVASQCGDAKLAANWITGELAARLNSEDQLIQHCPVSAEQLAALIARIVDKTISNKMAREVFGAMWDGEGEPDSIIEARGLKQVSDSGAIEGMVDTVIANSAKQVDNYRNADEVKRPKMLGYFVGQIMKASKGQANPQQVNEVLLKKLNALL